MSIGEGAKGVKKDDRGLTCSLLTSEAEVWYNRDAPQSGVSSKEGGLHWRKLIGVAVCCTVVLATVFVGSPRPPAAIAAGTNSVETPDTGQVGDYTSLVLDSSGNPVISYFDSSASSDLKVMHCNDPDCSGGDESIESPHTAGSSGQWTSIALDANGYPVVSFYDATNSALLLLHCNDEDCADSNDSVETVDNSGDVGTYTSLVLDSNGFPVISYYDAGPDDLKLVHCNDENCAGGDESIETVDAFGITGAWSSLALDSNGFPVISYSGGFADLTVMHCNDENCAGGDESIEYPHTVNNVGAYSSLALDDEGFPVISYNDGTAGDLWVMHCGDADCSSGNVAAAQDTVGVVGSYTSLELDDNGRPVVSYNAGLAEVRILHCNDVDCAGGDESIETADSGGGGNGFYTSLALDSNDRAVVSYRTSGGPNLGVLHCGDVNCSGAKPLALTVDSTGDAGDASPGDGTCDDGGGSCTLRAAIEEASANGGEDTVSFDSGTFPPASPTTLSPGSGYTMSGDGDTVDATDAGVRISGGAFDCFTISGSGNQVVGIELITGCARAVRVTGAGNTIGGANLGETGAECSNATDDDDDGYVNDGCPESGSTSESGAECTLGDTTNDDAGDDALVNDGCPARGQGMTMNTSGLRAVEISGSTATGNQVLGNLIGTNEDGTAAAANTVGVRIESGATSNTIGGDTVGERNVISGSTLYGIWLITSGSNDNIITGNYIGTSLDGGSGIGNGSVGIFGEAGVTRTVVGGAATPAGTPPGNVISDNGDGTSGAILFNGGASVIKGNLIGTDAAGTSPLGNSGAGLRLFSTFHTVGGSGAGEGNVIAASTQEGVRLGGASAQVLGNYIGTDITGTNATGFGNDRGILVAGGTSAIIGGTAGTTPGGPCTGACNLISGNTEHGIHYSGGSSTTVQGNYIGTDVTGELNRGNVQRGISLLTSDNVIGGTTAGAGNLISGNGDDGILISGGSATGNTMQGNLIGTDVDGTDSIANGMNGVFISGAPGNTIGGAASGAGNLISGNTEAGVRLETVGATGNTVLGNLIGTDVDGTGPLANGTSGVYITGAPSNAVGGTAAGAGNVISGNTEAGVEIETGNAAGNVVVGNLIGTDGAGTASVANGTHGVLIHAGADNNIIGGGNTIAYNTDAGVCVHGGSSTGNVIRGNATHSNGDLGIDLRASGTTCDGAVNENDPDDVDAGTNGGQNFPDLTSAVTGSVTVEGALDSTPSTTFLLDFYASASCDASGNGEGETYLGPRIVTTDGSGDASFTFTSHQTVAPGTFITATATDPSGNTSEFSDCFTATEVEVLDLVGQVDTPGDCPEGGMAGDLDCLVDGPHGMHAPPVGGGGGGEAAGASSILYFADTGNDKVKKIEPPTVSGTVNTIAGGGSGTCGGSEENALGDGCDPTDAILNAPRDVYVSPAGDIYIADTDNCLVRRISGGLIDTVAGTGACGYNGDGMDATTAQLNFPSGVIVDEDDNLYIADTENCRIRKVDAGGTITTVAGTGTCGYSGDRGPATGSQLNRPRDVAILFPDDDLIIADTDNHRIRRVYLPGGDIASVAGTGAAGYDGGATVASSAAVNAPEALEGVNYRVLVADTGNQRIRRINVLTNTIDTLIGVDGHEPPATLNEPAGVTALGVEGASDPGGDSIAWSDADRHVLGTSEIGADNDTTEALEPIHSCAILPGTSSIDWLLPAALFGVVVFRRRLGMLLALLRAVAVPAGRAAA